MSIRSGSGQNCVLGRWVFIGTLSNTTPRDGGLGLGVSGPNNGQPISGIEVRGNYSQKMLLLEDDDALR